MANETKRFFLKELTRRFGTLRRLGNSQSLFEMGNGAARIYVRYSKKHSKNQAFYGLRKEDVQMIEGRPSVLCFLWNDQKEPLLIPFAEYEDLFATVPPANDGQYKVQVYEQNDITELYIPKAGRFNVESCFGWSSLENLVNASILKVPDLSHSQVQTLLGSIGTRKGFDIWVPANDRMKMDWSLTSQFDCCHKFPPGLDSVKWVVGEIDIIWIERGSGIAKAFFEVEHSTPIYSGLLRFNDVHLVAPQLNASFSVVSNDERRSLFVRQLNRPTFQMSGLGKVCNFLEYRNVYEWHDRVR